MAEDITIPFQMLAACGPQAKVRNDDNLILSNLVHDTCLVVKYYGQLKNNLTHKCNLSRSKGHLSSIQRIIVATKWICFC